MFLLLLILLNPLLQFFSHSFTTHACAAAFLPRHLAFTLCRCRCTFKYALHYCSFLFFYFDSCSSPLVSSQIHQFSTLFIDCVCFLIKLSGLFPLTYISQLPKQCCLMMLCSSTSLPEIPRSLAYVFSPSLPLPSQLHAAALQVFSLLWEF